MLEQTDSKVTNPLFPNQANQHAGTDRRQGDQPSLPPVELVNMLEQTDSKATSPLLP